MPYAFFPCTPSWCCHCYPCWEDEVNLIRSVIPKTKSEPEAVYQWFFEPKAVADWQRLMSLWQPPLNYGAVFAHARPYVKTVAAGERCELGDLMIVFTDHGQKIRRALLLQAKMGPGKWPPMSSKGDRIQWTLYTKWNEFEFTDLPGKGRPSFKLPLGKPDPAAQYLILHKGTGKECYGQLAHDPNPPTGPPKDTLAELLHKFANGGVGRMFSYKMPPHSGAKTDDWDRLIWDLINDSQTATFPARSTRPRKVGTFFMASASFCVDDNDGKGFNQSLCNNDAQGGSNDNDRSQSDDQNQGRPHGIPIIYIWTGEPEHER